ncbi:hypothetical protein ABID22_001516 [Pontibacter aydingkolensis]|uniref:Uncharacterized protein n=1 Tax=Pontibacter aydingkolensis TaxID=1911536 RepID=A0ABS7CTS4_9BACT|nr:hypothetical protein [Pontibacter aydingkolensis]MBW7467190.1 hypothetical protein [Pontibacter aydingkolensis]
MDDFKIILYILAAVAYFLFTQWRKAFNTPGDKEQEMEEQKPQRRRVEPQQPQRPVTSFEDILRELQPKVDKGRAEAEIARERVREIVTPPVIAEERVPKYKSYEGTTQKALSWENAADAREAKRRSKEMREPVFKAYAQESEAPTSRYAKLLRNPASVKEAFILTEIFNRKYNY